MTSTDCRSSATSELYAWHQPTAPDAKPISEPSAKRVVPEGQRNTSLYRHLMREARRCENLNALIVRGRDFNASCWPRLADEEIMRTAQSVWDYTSKGKNRFASSAPGSYSLTSLSWSAVATVPAVRSCRTPSSCSRSCVPTIVQTMASPPS